MNSWLKFVERKIETAIMLDEGKCNGSYSDACILLSALISGIAAELWPGDDRIDRRRFIELWTRYCGVELQANRISIPLFRRYLLKNNRTEAAAVLEQQRPEILGLSCRLLCGTDVDMSEPDLLKLPINLKRAEVRRYSYPAIFYRHVRSNLVHEYKVSDDAADHFATRRDADVSYLNMLDVDGLDRSRRLIHFHVGWLAKAVRSIATNVATLVDNYTTLPRPAKWWIDA